MAEFSALDKKEILALVKDGKRGVALQRIRAVASHVSPTEANYLLASWAREENAPARETVQEDPAFEDMLRHISTFDQITIALLRQHADKGSSIPAPRADPERLKEIAVQALDAMRAIIDLGLNPTSVLLSFVDKEGAIDQEEHSLAKALLRGV